MTSVPIEQVVAECHRTLRRGDSARAVSMVRELARQAPGDPRSRLLQAMTSIVFGKGAEAASMLSGVIDGLPEEDRRLGEISLARAETLAGNYEAALAWVDPIASENPAPGGAVAAKAETLIAAGRLDDAEAWLDSASVAEGEGHEPAIARGRLALATPAGAEALGRREEAAIGALAAERERVGVPAAPLSDVMLLLGELRARRGEDTEAAKLFKRSAGLNPSRADPRPYAQTVMKVITAWGEKGVARAQRSKEGEAAETERPVFVVGMPGGGPELAGRLLRACPGAVGTPDIEALMSSVMRSVEGGQAVAPDPAKLTGKQVAASASAYLDVTAPADPSATRVIDDFPLNLHVLGVVAQLFPRARVVLVRREDFDACMACMLRHRNPRLLYAHDPRSLAVFAGGLRRLEDHWMGVFAGERLGLRTLELEYAALATGAAAGELFEFAGLEPPGDEAVERELSEHGRWTGHGTGLSERFGALLPEVSGAVEQAEIGRV
jgi:Flp pilus assembly protein TadD